MKNNYIKAKKFVLKATKKITDYWKFTPFIVKADNLIWLIQSIETIYNFIKIFLN